MPKKILHITTFSPKDTDKFIFDANVLIDIFTELNFPKDLSTNHYSTFFYDKLRPRKIKPYISSLLLSELFNRYIRFNFDLFRKSRNNPKLDFKKDYRVTSEYTEKMSAILSIIEDDIIPNFNLLDDTFTSMSINNVLALNTFFDFNDGLLVELCHMNGLILITHDSDFGQILNKPTILTSNQKLIKFT